MNINLNFRPSTYFWPQSLETKLLSTVKGADRQDQIRALITSNRLDELPDWLAHESLDTPMREALGRIHPSLMGGEYLPDLLPKEVEIARVSLMSVTGDVISVRARRGKHHIYYQVADEYEDCSELEQPSRRSSIKPITLGQLEQMIEEAGVGLDIVKRNLEYGASWEELHYFMSVTSTFYPELESLYDYRVGTWLASVAPPMEGDESGDAEGEVSR